MPRTLIPILLLLLPHLLHAQRHTGGEERGLKILPVSDLLFRCEHPTPPRLGVLTRVLHDDEPQSLLARSEYFHGLESDTVIDFVQTSLGEAGDQVSLVVRDRSLVVSGSTAHIEEVEKIVAQLRRAMTQRFLVRATLYRIDANGEFPARASVAQLAELTKGLPKLWSGETTTLSGQPVLLAQEGYIDYVQDVDVEVAEESSIGDPRTNSMFEGIRLVVESHALIGSTDRVLMCQYAIGERQRDIELVSTGVQGLPTIGIPHLYASSGGFAGRIEHDGGLLLALQGAPGAGSNLLLVLQVGTQGGPALTDVSVGSILVLPISAMTSMSLRCAQPLKEHWESPESRRAGYPNLSPEMEDDGRGASLVALLMESLGSLLDQSGSGVNLVSNGGTDAWLLLRGSEELRTRGHRLLAALQDRELQTVEIQARTGLAPAADTGSIFPVIESEAAGQTLHSVTAPSLVGHCTLVHSGIESAVVHDYDVEIASKAAVANPVVKTTFSGVAIGVRPDLEGTGIGADVRIFLQHVPEPRRQPTAQDKGGDLYHTYLGKADYQRAGAVNFGQAMHLGWGPHVTLGQQCLRMYQTVRFRKL